MNSVATNGRPVARGSEMTTAIAAAMRTAVHEAYTSGGQQFKSITVTAKPGMDYVHDDEQGKMVSRPVLRVHARVTITHNERMSLEM